MRYGYGLGEFVMMECGDEFLIKTPYWYPDGSRVCLLWVPGDDLLTDGGCLWRWLCAVYPWMVSYTLFSEWFYIHYSSVYLVESDVYRRVEGDFVVCLNDLSLSIQETALYYPRYFSKLSKVGLS